MISAFVLAAILSVQAPPARYDFEPKIPVSVIEVSSPNMTCRRIGGRNSGTILACAVASKSRCIIIWPAGKRRAGLMWRHERAHCNGWPSYHPR